MTRSDLCHRGSEGSGNGLLRLRISLKQIERLGCCFNAFSLTARIELPQVSLRQGMLLQRTEHIHPPFGVSMIKFSKFIQQFAIVPTLNRILIASLLVIEAVKVPALDQLLLLDCYLQILCLVFAWCEMKDLVGKNRRGQSGAKLSKEVLRVRILTFGRRFPW